MKIIKHYQNDNPTLYLVPTPIGNLEDITFRALNILKEVDIVFAEDTRTSRKLFTHFDIKTKMDSYHDHNEEQKMNVLIEKLISGKNIALISDAGMPLISDPGYHLVQKAIEKDFNVVALPGANALLPALIMSGIKTQPFVFLGFLDNKIKKRHEMIERVKYYPETLIFYESIHRVKDTVKDLFNVLGDRQFTIAREISKSYEETIRGKLSEYDELKDLKGELVLIVEGYTGELMDDKLTIIEQVDYFIKQGLKKTEAMKKVSQMTQIPKNKIYQEYLHNKIKEE
ncbi:MAG: 16S rRNA (cytidine(1402)-2'-O)-methyltransferase [Tenericutes bacterium]|jgi:16S rRNA (cytidine1402-2'-O)-methyltransferase|nr:16S rRNA (cytidine(1402)-2'-O)-methyltransferase [Mycoplasmatota bacterium]